jgi:nitrogen fixation/metabolism regulation signal transduction histidine kinase
VVVFRVEGEGWRCTSNRSAGSSGRTSLGRSTIRYLFFTTHPTGPGTGLGLTVAKAIADVHGAIIGIANRPAGGIGVAVTFKA